MSTKMSDDERERLRLATASIEKLDAAAAKEESLLRKLVTSLDKEGIVKFKDSTNYTIRNLNTRNTVIRIRQSLL